MEEKSWTDHPRYKDVVISDGKPFDPDRFWEYKKWPYRLADGVEQFDYLVSYGLKPHHYFLDVGCGWLRGGINFIDYLDVGHYYGFDKDEKQLDKGERLLKGKELIHKKPVIDRVTDSRGVWYFVGSVRFDYMLAYSVFTHTDPYMTARLFDTVINFLKPGGKFFATFHKRKGPTTEVWVGGSHNSRSDEYKQVRYPASFFDDLARKNEMTFEYLGIVSDVHYQDWMCFKRK